MIAEERSPLAPLKKGGKGENQIQRPPFPLLAPLLGAVPLLGGVRGGLAGVGGGTKQH